MFSAAQRCCAHSNERLLKAVRSSCSMFSRREARMFAATARQIARMRWGEWIAIGRTRRCDRRVVAQPSPTKKPCNRLAGARSQAGSAPQSTHRGHVHSRSTSDAPNNELRPLRAVKGMRCGICAPTDHWPSVICDLISSGGGQVLMSSQGEMIVQVKRGVRCCITQMGTGIGG